MNLEARRKVFLPPKVKVLFVGESPPRNGGFFYGNPDDFSPMTGHYQRVFQDVFRKPFENPKEFLEYFKSLGCYLDDICHKPVDHLSPNKRRDAIDKSIGKLSKRIEEYQPEYVITFLKRIHGYVEKAVMHTNLSICVRSVPFPGNSHQTKFENELKEILRKIYLEKNEDEAYERILERWRGELLRIVETNVTYEKEESLASALRKMVESKDYDPSTLLECADTIDSLVTLSKFMWEERKDRETLFFMFRREYLKCSGILQSQNATPMTDEMWDEMTRKSQRGSPPVTPL